MDEPQRMTDMAMQRKRLDQYKSFFSPTLADNQESYYSSLRPCLGAELSVANLEWEHIYSFVLQIKCAQEMAGHGQDDLLMDIQTTMTGELKLSGSRDGLIVSHIFSNKIEYSQTQEVHEHQHPVRQRRGLFGGGSRSPPQGR